MVGKTFSHYVAVAIGASQPQTQTTEAERQLLTKYLPGKKRVVEIGVFEGYTTRLLAGASDADATVYGVDPFFRGRVGISWGFLIAKLYNRNHLRDGKLRLIRAFSTGVNEEVPAVVDFVFIDADHSLKAITADWAFWSDRLQPGGIIALHDTLRTSDQGESAELGSQRYFRTHIRHDPLFEIVDQVDSLSILQKRSVG